MRGFAHPGRLIPVAFLLAILGGTGLLLLPWATQPGRHTRLLDAAFTSVSATCLTGLSTVDTSNHWSSFGLAVILLQMQVGALGIMTMATLLTVLVTGKLGLSSALVAQEEAHTSKNLGDIRRLVGQVAVATLLTEVAIGLVLSLRLRGHYHLAWDSAIWRGLFHAVSAFTNASFSLYSDSLIGFHSDPWIVLPLCFGVFSGGLGFPVYFELVRHWKLVRPWLWSAHSRMTVLGTAVLLVLGVTSIGTLEWRNPATLGGYDLPGRLLGSVAAGVFPRTAGFNTFDYASATPESLLLSDILMFIGGGSASTAGGIKVTTFVLLGFTIWSEIRNQADVTAWHRRIGRETLRQAISVAILSLTLLVSGTLVILVTSDFSLDHALFEAASAFATCGLSTGVAMNGNLATDLTLMVLMFCGRVGTITVASAMAIAPRHHHYRLPEERPIVG